MLCEISKEKIKNSFVVNYQKLLYYQKTQLRVLGVKNSRSSKCKKKELQNCNKKSFWQNTNKTLATWPRVTNDRMFKCLK